MKRKIPIIILALLLGAGGYWGYRWYNQAPQAGLQATGTIEATQVQLTAKLPGTLQDFTVKEGDPVKKGQLVGSLLRNDLVAQRERDALGVIQAQAQLDDLLAGARQQELRDAEIAVSIAETNYEKAGKDYDRAVELHQGMAISDAELEKADTAYKQAANQLESANAKLSLLRSGSRTDQIAAAQAGVEQSAAVLKASEVLLEDTKIICPIDGVILSKNFEQGEYVQAGSAVATAANLNDMWIRVYIPTDDLPQVKLGQPVTFTVSGSSVEYTGTVEEIAGKGEFTPKTIQTKKERTNIVYAVKIRVDNEGGALKPGMPADVIIQ